MNAFSSIPSGVLRQTGGEPMTAQQLADVAAAFNAVCASNQIVVLNEFVEYNETVMTPDRMLLIDSPNYSALEAARRAAKITGWIGCGLLVSSILSALTILIS